MHLLKLTTPSPSALLLTLSLPAIADATYSIVATEGQTHSVGGAGASCVQNGDVFAALYHSTPNQSVLHMQGLVMDDADIVTAVEGMMADDASIDEVLAKMKVLDGGALIGLPMVELWQHGMTNFKAKSHGRYTGKLLQKLYDEVLEIQDTVQVDLGVGRGDPNADARVSGRYSHHAKGNVVTNGTVKALSNEFVAGGGDDDPCDDLPARLMESLTRAVEGGLGDIGCIVDFEGLSASSAFLHVDHPDGTEYMHLNVVGDRTFEPVEAPKKQYLIWRESHPCNLAVV
ncbi:hypothetical protein ACHAWF_002199 [Thalassiosira exigua]